MYHITILFQSLFPWRSARVRERFPVPLQRVRGRRRRRDDQRQRQHGVARGHPGQAQQQLLRLGAEPAHLQDVAVRRLRSRVRAQASVKEEIIRETSYLFFQCLFRCSNYVRFYF